MHLITLENISKEQFQTLHSIKEFIKEFPQVDWSRFTDHYLLRFCKAWQFNLEKTKEMIKNHIEWIIANDVDNLGSLDMSKYDFLK